jgi:hypothetical protein
MQPPDIAKITKKINIILLKKILAAFYSVRINMYDLMCSILHF